MKWLGSTSDYMAWVTSSLCQKLEDNALTMILLKGMTIVGDNAYVKKLYMATPLKGQQSGHRDAYNFYCSQIRITIERAFGVLVHRWAILRSPLVIPVHKVSSLVLCLCRLHNFCIDCNEKKTERLQTCDAINLNRNVQLSNMLYHQDESSVTLENGRPTDLIGLGHHFWDAPLYRRPTVEKCPMDDMIDHVK